MKHGIIEIFIDRAFSYLPTPPVHQVDGVWVHPRHEDRHAPPCTEGDHADVLLGEPDGWD